MVVRSRRGWRRRGAAAARGGGAAPPMLRPAPVPRRRSFTAPVPRRGAPRSTRPWASSDDAIASLPAGSCLSVLVVLYAEEPAFRLTRSRPAVPASLVARRLRPRSARHPASRPGRRAVWHQRHPPTFLSFRAKFAMRPSAFDPRRHGPQRTMLRRAFVARRQPEAESSMPRCRAQRAGSESGSEGAKRLAESAGCRSACSTQGG